MCAYTGIHRGIIKLVRDEEDFRGREIKCRNMNGDRGIMEQEGLNWVVNGKARVRGVGCVCGNYLTFPYQRHSPSKQRLMADFPTKMPSAKIQKND